MPELRIQMSKPSDHKRKLCEPEVDQMSKKSTQTVAVGDVARSAIAVGPGAQASNYSSDSEQLAEAKMLIANLITLIESANLGITQKDALQARALAVRNELDKKKPNLKTASRTMKWIATSLGPAESLTTIATQLLDIFRRLC
jgi:hypothetical protein